MPGLVVTMVLTPVLVVLLTSVSAMFFGDVVFIGVAGGGGVWRSLVAWPKH